MERRSFVRSVVIGLFGWLVTGALVLFLAGCMDPVSSRPLRSASPSVSILNIPQNVTNVAITVTGSGMDDIEVEVPTGQSSVTLLVPEGPNRRFSFSADLFEYGSTTVLNPSVWYDGESTQSVSFAGGEVRIPASLRSQIMVPFLDWEGAVARIFEDTSPLVEVGDFPIGDQTLAIDFDHLGRIYLGRNPLSGALIQRRNSPTSGPNTVFLSPGGAITGNVGIVSLSIDRPGRWIYHASDSRIWRTRYDETSNPAQTGDTVELTNIEFPNGLDPDSGHMITAIAFDQADGTLLIAQQRQLFRFDPEASTVSDVFPQEFNIESSDQITDVRVRDQNVLVLFHYSEDFAPVVELDRDLLVVRQYGTFVTGEAGPDQFNEPSEGPNGTYGVFRFVAVLNRRIGILESASTWDPVRVAIVDDLDGTGWAEVGFDVGCGTNFPVYPVVSVERFS